mgnify:CR=1 FL=1
MIKEITNEIDKTISSGNRNNPKLLELVVAVMADKKDLPQKFVDMCFDIHEADTDTAEDEKTQKEAGLHSPKWFLDFLTSTKKEDIKFWNSVD